MEDIILKAALDDSLSLYISPIDRQTYAEQVAENDLGGGGGYFVLLSRKVGLPKLEVLAKVPTIEAATTLFDLIAARHDGAGEDCRSYSLEPLFL